MARKYKRPKQKNSVKLNKNSYYIKGLSQDELFTYSYKLKSYLAVESKLLKRTRKL